MIHLFALTQLLSFKLNQLLINLKLNRALLIVKDFVKDLTIDKNMV